MTTKRDQALFSTGLGYPNSPIESDTQETTNSPYLVVEQAADYLRVSKNYLDKLRVSGKGPRFVRLGRRYRKSDLDKWVEERIYASTTQYES